MYPLVNAILPPTPFARVCQSTPGIICLQIIVAGTFRLSDLRQIGFGHCKRQRYGIRRCNCTIKEWSAVYASYSERIDGVFLQSGCRMSGVIFAELGDLYALIRFSMCALGNFTMHWLFRLPYYLLVVCFTCPSIQYWIKRRLRYTNPPSIYQEHLEIS